MHPGSLRRKSLREDEKHLKNLVIYLPDKEDPPFQILTIKKNEETPPRMGEGLLWNHNNVECNLLPTGDIEHSDDLLGFGSSPSFSNFASRRLSSWTIFRFDGKQLFSNRS
jgi:hypothetical protein